MGINKMAKKQVLVGFSAGMFVGFGIGMSICVIVSYISSDVGYHNGVRDQAMYENCIYEQTHYNRLATDFEVQVCHQMVEDKS